MYPALSSRLQAGVGFLMLALTTSCGGGDGGTDILLPSLNVSTSTTGIDTDPDGYTFTVDGQNPRPIGVQATVTIDRLTDGQHTVELVGVAPNCAVAGENPKAVSITSGATASVPFIITCQAGSGGVRVVTTTSGAGSDPDGFTLLLDGTDRGPIGLNAEAIFNGVPEGSHTVGLGGLAGNCQADENPRSLTVVGGEVTEVSFAVTCTEPEPTSGTLEVRVQTTGTNLDPDGYQVTVDGGAGQVVGVNATVTLANVPAGSHSAGLGGLAANCQVAGENPRSVTVTAGGTSEVTFAVTCTAAPPVTGTLRISVQTTGVNQDTDGYRISVDGGAAQPIGTNATISLANISAAQHTVRLQGLAANCAVTGNNPLGAAVPAGGTATVSFAVTCVATTGELRVTISGLPAGVQAAVTVTGPNNFNRAVTETETLTGLTPGNYDVSAVNVTSSGTTYTPNVSRPDVDVAAGGTATVTVTYTGQAPVTLNLHIDGLYLTQSTQNSDGSVPLVAGRDAYLRVFVVANQTNNARPRVRAQLSRSGATIQTYTIDAPGSSVTTQVQEGVLGSSWNQRIPGSLIQPGLSIVAELDPSGAIDESNETDNRFPATGTKALTVRSAPTARIRFISVQQGSSPPGDISNPAQLVDQAQRMHPLSSIETDSRQTVLTASQPLQPGGDGWGQLVSDIFAIREADPDGSSWTYFGIVRLGYGRQDGLVGLTLGLGLPASAGWDDASDASRVVAHELGHVWGRRHSPCGNPPDVDGLYPYPDGSIRVFGLDVTAPVTQSDVKSPSSPDIMSYCFGSPWISDYTYEKILEFRASASGARVASVSQPSLLIRGRIENEQVVLEPVFHISARPSLPRRPGPYSLSGSSLDGTQLFAFSFDAAPALDDPKGTRHFAFVVPLDEVRTAQLTNVRLSANGLSSSRSSGKAQLQMSTGQESVIAQRNGAHVVLRWDSGVYPMIMVRDPDTGEVLSFARGGLSEVWTSKNVLDLIVSDGVRSRQIRTRVNP